MSYPSRATARMLYALSGNSCALPDCEKKLFDRKWNSVLAVMAHIKGENDGSARFDATMTDEQRCHFDNLIVVCPNCHTKIDALVPDDYPAERLFEIKAKHEARAESPNTWSTETEFENYVVIGLAVQFPDSILDGDTSQINANIELTAQVSAELETDPDPPTSRDDQRTRVLHEESRSDDRVTAPGTSSANPFAEPVAPSDGEGFTINKGERPAVSNPVFASDSLSMSDSATVASFPSTAVSSQDEFVEGAVGSPSALYRFDTDERLDSFSAWFRDTYPATTLTVDRSSLTARIEDYQELGRYDRGHIQSVARDEHEGERVEE